MSAVILSPPPATTVFIRVSADATSPEASVFVAQPRSRGSTLPAALPAVTRDTVMRVERLILAGT